MLRVLTLKTKSGVGNPCLELHYFYTNRNSGELDIDCIQDIEWNDEAFEKLVLPGAEKKMILALLERQKPQVAKFADSIRDKGECQEFYYSTCRAN